MGRDSITREELFAMVWAEPGTHVAKKLEISDVAVVKICRKLDVPRPPRGYWAKLKHGYDVNKPNLPATKESTPGTYFFDRRGTDQSLAGRAVDAPAVEIPETLKGCHPIIRLMKRDWASCEKDRYGRRTCEGLLVTHRASTRALRILDAVVRYLEEKGHKLSASKNKVLVEIGEERVAISMEEGLSKSEHVPTARELREKQRYSWTRIPKYDYKPSGKLKIRCRHRYLYGRRTTHGDRKRKSLEELLGLFLVATESAIEIVREESIADARRRYEDMLRWRRDKRIEVAIRATHERASLIDAYVADFVKTQRTRAWVETMESASDLSPDKLRLVRWAHEYSDHIDPTKRRRIAYLDESPKARKHW